MPIGRLTRLSRWLVPTLVAPALTASVAVTVHVWGQSWALLRWLGLMWIGTTAALVLSVALLLSDWVLLLIRLREPPLGKRAWLSSGVAPVVAYGLWVLLRPPLLSPPSTHALYVAGAAVAAALLVRLVTSPRRGSGTRFS
jgi:hypothetical protein